MGNDIEAVSHSLLVCFWRSSRVAIRPSRSEAKLTALSAPDTIHPATFDRGHRMTAWAQLFGDQLATVSGGQQTLFPTNEHLGGEKYCMVIVTTYDCPTCPAFFRRLRAWKPAMAGRGVGIVVCYAVDTERQHLQLAEEYGEVQMPIGFPTSPELLEKKWKIQGLIGKYVPSYAVFDQNLEMVVDVVTSNLRPLVDWLQTLETTEPDAPPVERVAVEDEEPQLLANAEAEVVSENEPSSAVD